MKNIVILGSTGSIGTQTLDVVRNLPGQFNILGLSAGANVNLLCAQVNEHKPLMVCANPIEELAKKIDPSLISTVEHMVTNPKVELVMIASTGLSGLLPTLKALEAGKTVALANKEVIVMAGELLVQHARKHNAQLIPVDSEPSAIWQCLRGESSLPSKLLITASGGPFRKTPLDKFELITPEQALAHPTWKMGGKITIDSSTLMNKAFEVIESRWLFDIPFDKIEVYIHPQSVIHSMVEFADGSVKAQIGPPDMRTPIQVALTYPERQFNPSLAAYNPLDYPSLTFEKLDLSRYPCFSIGLQAGLKGLTYPTVLSSADEECVHHFLGGTIGFNDIPALLRNVLDAHTPNAVSCLEDILEADAFARSHIKQFIANAKKN